MLARKLLFDVVSLQIDLHTAMRIDFAREGLPVYAGKRAVRIDLLGKQWQCWQDWMRDTRGSVSARPPLMWALLGGFSSHAKVAQAQGLALHPTSEWRPDDRRGSQEGCVVVPEALGYRMDGPSS